MSLKIYNEDALKFLPRLAEKFPEKFDMFFLDIPYKTPAIVGGNRGAKFPTISPDQFREVLESIRKLCRNKHSYLVYMYSIARSGWNEMQKYNKALLDAGFKGVQLGEYFKYQKDGLTRCRNMRGDEIPPEQILILNQSGQKARRFRITYRLIRPKGFQFEKPATMLKSIISQTTAPGNMIIDPFMGSGVALAEAYRLNRNSIGVEINQETIDRYAIPKIKLVYHNYKEN